MFHVFTKKGKLLPPLLKNNISLNYYKWSLLIKYHHICRYEMSSMDVPLVSWHDGSAGPQNKAGHGEWVHLNQMGHSIIPHQRAVNVVSGSHVSSHLVLP